MSRRLGILSTHPIQYYSPLYRELTNRTGLELSVYYSHRQTVDGQAKAGFGVRFEWDVPLLDGYSSQFLNNVASLPSTDSRTGCDTPEIADIIRRERFDGFLVHGWYNRSFRQAIRACWASNTPVFVRGDSTLLGTTGWIRRAVKRVARRRLVPRFDAYLTVGRRAREYYLYYGADPAKMLPSPHFIDNDRFARQAAEWRPRRAELRARWGLRADAVVFLFAGKFLHRKRPAEFVRAVAAAGPPAAGLLVGEGPLRGELEHLAIGAEVRFTGFLNQTEIPAAYVAADVVVLPSDGSETWGLVVNEGMACGLPAVVSDTVGCGPDLVTPGETGVVVPLDNVAALTAALRRLAADPAAVARMGAAARQRVLNNYNVRAAADGCEQALELPTRGSRR